MVETQSASYKHEFDSVKSALEDFGKLFFSFFLFFSWMFVHINTYDSYHHIF